MGSTMRVVAMLCLYLCVGPLWAGPALAQADDEPPAGYVAAVRAMVPGGTVQDTMSRRTAKGKCMVLVTTKQPVMIVMDQIAAKMAGYGWQVVLKQPMNQKFGQANTPLVGMMMAFQQGRERGMVQGRTQDSGTTVVTFMLPCGLGGSGR